MSGGSLPASRSGGDARHEFHYSAGQLLTSTIISRASAAFLLLCGLALLFAPSEASRGLSLELPVGALWFAQMLGGAWLGLAALNWFSRAAILGGIYGRPIVMANLTTYFVSALVLLKAAQHGAIPGALWVLAAIVVLAAAAYGALLFRGPFGSELDTARR